MTNTQNPATAPSFHTLGIAPQLLRILDSHKLLTPTPIQQQSIGPAIEGKDIVGIAQTGTGKTFAFGVPMIQRLAYTKGQALILIPTRELADQVEKSLRIFTSVFHIRTAVIIGGASMEGQKANIRRNPHIVIATPGRLQDHLKQRTISLQKVNILVLDEADRMFDMGFRPQIEQILRFVPRERQTLLFSATMPPEIMKLVHAHMKLPLRIEVAPAGTTVAAIQQELFIIQKSEKTALLETILNQYAGTILIFSRTKHGAKKLTRLIESLGHRAAEIHSNRSLAQRREALEGFKTGKYRVLVATDIAARGIDVSGIEVVLNFDLPDDAGDYVHRIGRTGRAGKKGLAISFATADQKDNIRKIERLIRSTLQLKQTPTLPKGAQQLPERPPYQGRPAQNRPRGFSSKRRSGQFSRGHKKRSYRH